MNYKMLFVVALGIGALGYYAHDTEVPYVSDLVHKVWAKDSRAEAVSTKNTKKRAGKKRAAKSAASAKSSVGHAEEGSSAAPEAAPAAKPAPVPAESGSSRVAEVLAKLPLVKAVTPNTEARYYIYLMSAGWCGPCNMEMPHIVKAYEEIKASGVVEIILVDFDDTPENARAYMDKYGATFPAIMKDDAAVLPGIKPPSGIPFAMIVDDSGNLITSGHGSIIQNWRQHTMGAQETSGK